jgi:hypothetical protein
MRVCQFRHYGTAGMSRTFFGAGHGSRESLVLQRLGPLSIVARLPYTGTAEHSQPRESVSPQFMSESPQIVPAATEIPEELALEIRKLAHDLSNALEIIVQTSYLLGTVEMKEPGSDWLRMLDSGVRKALDINLSLRSYIKTHSPH